MSKVGFKKLEFYAEMTHFSAKCSLG